MIPKVIKTRQEYQKALDRLTKLMDAKLNTAEGDELELLATLVELYEEEHFPIDLPDPIDAIKFRMEQAGLKQKDLVPYLGSRSKVSEVLNRKRPLSLTMIRALRKNLGIPAEVLLQEKGATIPDDTAELDWNRFPISEMLNRGWFANFSGDLAEAKEQAEELIRDFFQPITSIGLKPALLRQHVRTGSTMNKYALLAWQVRVLTLAQEESVPEYKRRSITSSFMQGLVHLSYLNEGPKLAQEFLAKNGIHLITLRHLPKTHLDGAAMMLPAGTPVVALTLRHDRLDNFWFSLCHELAHVVLHLEKNNKDDCFMDDLDSAGNQLEDQADKFAADALIPPKRWGKAPVRRRWNATEVKEFANSLKLHHAIVAGRIRREQDNYRILSPLVGLGQVRKYFEKE